MTPRLAALVVYPVKSCAGIEVRNWAVDERGLQHDRSFMVVDAGTGAFLSQRVHPSLALVRPALAHGMLLLQTPIGQAAIDLAAAASTRLVQVWEHRGPARDCGDAAAELLSAHLRRPVRLVALPPEHAREADPGYAGPGVPVGFSDGYPLLVIGQASLDDLNRRLQRPLPLNRFRPNLVITGAAPFAEDGWSSIRIGGIDIDLVKPCTRCAITTVDQATGLRDGGEPLAALAGFRRGPRGVEFGQNAVHRGQGMLRVGDQVFITGLKD
jgi:hypothetical protein